MSESAAFYLYGNCGSGAVRQKSGVLRVVRIVYMQLSCAGLCCCLYELRSFVEIKTERFVQRKRYLGESQQNAVVSNSTLVFCDDFFIIQITYGWLVIRHFQI